jgi:hypothetical protein
LTGDDLGPVAFAAAVLRFVLARIQPSLDVNLTAFAQQSLAVVREFSESNDPVPFNALLLVAVAVFEPRFGRYR